MTDRTSYEWVRPPWWRRWLLRLLVLLAFAAVIVAGLKIYHEFQDDKSSTDSSALKTQLTDLAKYGGTMAGDLERLTAGSAGTQAKAAVKKAVIYQKKAVAELRRRQTENLSTPQEAQTETALNAEFDWLDGVRTVLRNPKSPLLADLGDRGQKAIDAFNQLDEDRGMAKSIHGVTKLTAWAKAH